ncbi:hypothetical protein HERIO_2045 [Hepatospora eriocheir]|uniref:Uncharacterized protein n=1 Tax=Hepatospora eriocheir TaxID=1081669 RepID=A0A1X0Q8G8_9MICR|nr:hypothetical protein HERIO_2045 [Hepatospora eriocheir]
MTSKILLIKLLKCHIKLRIKFYILFRGVSPNNFNALPITILVDFKIIKRALAIFNSASFTLNVGIKLLTDLQISCK